MITKSPVDFAAGVGLLLGIISKNRQDIEYDYGVEVVAELLEALTKTYERSRTIYEEEDKKTAEEYANKTFGNVILNSFHA